MSDRIQMLPEVRSQRDAPDLSSHPGRGVMVALVIAVPFWAVIGGVTWALLG